MAKQIGVYTSTVNTWENNRFTPHVRYVPKIVTFLAYDPFPATPAAFRGRLKAAGIVAGLTRRMLAGSLDGFEVDELQVVMRGQKTKR